MNQSPVLAVSRPAVRRTGWETVFLFLVGTLASTVMLKFASIQYLEYIYFLQILILVVFFVRADLRAHIPRPLFTLGLGYLTVAILALVLALAALRFNFYMGSEHSLLQMPVAITLSRLAELLLDAVMMLYLSDLFRQRPQAARFTMRVYFWAGVLSVLFSILSYPLDRAGIVSLGAYGDMHRFRGFYNEGGPYGLYLITVLAVGWALVRLGWEPRRRTYALLALIVVGVAAAQSKAALVALFFLFALRSLFARRLAQRVATLTIGIVFLVGALQAFDLSAKVRLYQEAGSAYEETSHLHEGDANFVQGRIAGLFIIPRMIAAHPWTGIGLGNYGILRNDPQYRGGAAWGEPDEPGLGILGLAAETGVPLLLLLMICLTLPYFWLRRMRVPEYIANLALLQPVAHIFGAQLNLTYPWIVTAFALGVGYALHGAPASIQTNSANLVTA